MRRMLLLVLTGLVALGAGARAGGDDASGPKSAAVKRALVKRDRAVEQAEAAYRKAAADANKGLLAELKKAKDAAFLAKDEHELNAVSALVAATERELNASSRDDASTVAGVWLVGWGGGPYRYEFSRDATRVTDGTFKTLRFEQAGGTRTYLLTGNHVHRYRRAGEYLVAELWSSPAAHAGGDRPDQVAIARRPE